MPEGLNKPQLKQDYLALMTEMRTRADVSDEEFAERFATMIDNYTRSAKIIYTAGLVTPDAPVTGTFEGNLE